MHLVGCYCKNKKYKNKTKRLSIPVGNFHSIFALALMAVVYYKLFLVPSCCF